MANKRNLKKQVITLASTLIEDALYLKGLSTQEAVEQLDQIINSVVLFTDRTIYKINHPSTDIKSHYKDLKLEIKSQVNSFNEQLESLYR